MGSSEYDDEKPEHTVRITRAFYLGKYEVTQAQWKAVMGGDNPSRFQGDDRPVESVSWEDVQRFIQRLKAREAGVNYRLPTEAEWEYAARGTDARTYPWGNTFDGTRLNFCDQNCEFSWKDASVNDGYTTTAPVGKYPRGESPFGVNDMAGNVWEWVDDWYAGDTYKRRTAAATAAVDPRGPGTGSARVLRGGGWASTLASAGRRFASATPLATATPTLRLKDTAVRVLPVTQGIAFLGFRIFPGTVRLDGRKWAQWRRRIRQRQAAYNQRNIDERTLLRSVASLAGHVRHADTLTGRRRMWEADSFL